MKKILFSLLLSVLGLIVIRCGSGTNAGIPEVEPPVTAATPSGFTSTRRLGSVVGFRTADIDEVQSRFFSAGPTKISSLLDGIDSRISEINTRSGESTRACLSATAVQQDYTILGSSVSAFFQCYDVFSDSTGGMLFGKKDDTWYLYQNSGQVRSLAIVTPVTGQSGKYDVEAWMGVGQANATSSTCSSNWYGCSYGVIHLKANSAESTMEMTVAGTGFGYCGAHLKSDGTNLYVVGSAGQTSNGTSWTCASSDNVCTLANDTSSAGTCTTIDSNDFTLTTLGVTGQSGVGTGVTLNGTSTDSVHFGPAVSELSTISGVAAF
jgi:hypothetical protein